MRSFQFTLLSVVFAISASTAALAEDLSPRVADSVIRMQKAEAAGQYGVAYREGMRAFNDLGQELRLGDYVAQIRRQSDVVYDEVVTEQRTSGLSLEGLLLAFGFKGQEDKTKSILRNPEAKAETSATNQRALESLRRDIVGFMSDRADSIAWFKLLGVKLLQYSTRLSPAPSHQEIQAIENAALALNFQGTEQLTTCVTVNHVKSQQSTDISARMLFIGAGFNNTVTYHPSAESERECVSTVNTVQVRNQDVLLVNLSMLDQHIANWAKQAHAYRVLNVNPMPYQWFNLMKTPSPKP